VRIVLTGGGTGGHIYPALSVAQCLEGDDLLYVGSADGPEAAIVPKAGLEFRSVPTRKLSRNPTPSNLAALAVSSYGIFKGVSLLRAWKPDVVLGTGGFASTGIMFAALVLRIPTVIHEANAVPGRVNKLLGRWCTRIAVTYPHTVADFPPGKTVHTGMPVRRDLRKADQGKAWAALGFDPRKPLLLISGGSGGAQTLNRAVVGALNELGERGIQVAHQTGKTLYDAVIKELGDAPAHYRPLAYIDDMPSLLAAATLVICRGGSSTLAEVTALGKPAIVVPYPFAVADHQTANARALDEAGAAILIRDAEFSPERCLSECDRLLEDRALLQRMAEASKSLGRLDAARDVSILVRSTGGAEYSK
jgi:UDP-N-acetylglucosamine--N-acetylmuramyl-(pentapeptide) pyrophosphoryl-undecaprenol N-acetylglucosamine transferase